MADSVTEEARRAMIAKRFGGNKEGAATGGGGSVRRKKKVAHKSSNTDDKKLASSFKRLGLQPIAGIEEVNLFKDDQTIIHFTNPKVQASTQSNTYVVSGKGESKKISDLLPSIINQLGPEHLNNLRQLQQAMSQQQGGAASVSGAAVEEDDDDDIPELVENFEEASQK